MPTLEWIGKDKVINHHRHVPFRMLKRVYSHDEAGTHEEDNGSGNMIIRGDNLEALKALLPRFGGRIGCVYIDPPYNTGNEGWVYNDNVKDPKIARWLGEVVGREGEDLSRHDKWLCMITPRLKLLQKLLADDGVMFVSIDDTEHANLRLLCDELFGTTCFVADIAWQRTYSTRNDSKGIVSEVEHLLVYSKRPGWSPNMLPRTAEMDAKYKNPDNDVMPWTSSDAFAPGAATHQGMVYAIQHPFTGKMIYPSTSACWRYSQDQMLDIMSGWCGYELKDLHDEAERARVCGIPPTEVRPGVLAIVLSDTLENSIKNASQVLKRGQWPRFYFTKNGVGGIRRKTYLEHVGGRLPTNLWKYEDVGHTDEAKKELMALFDGRSPFDTPKPTRLLSFILAVAGNRDMLFLDSFAGSGTTAHAVLKANREDGGNRRFILVEMMDYADSITAERIKRVIRGYGTGSRHMEGTGGNFSFYDLGEPLLLPEGRLNPSVPLAEIRSHVWYMETGEALPGECPSRQLNRGNKEAGVMESPAFLGVSRGTAYYFHYDPAQVSTLDHAFLSTIRTHAEGYVVYADRCALSDSELVRYQVVFKKIPRDIPSL